MSDGPYKLPSGWRWVSLGEVATVKYGKANPRGDGEVPVVGSGGVYGSTSRALIGIPTIVIGRKGSAGSVALFEQPCWPSNTTFFLEWSNFDLHPRFVFYALLNRPFSTERAKTTLPTLQRQDVEGQLIPLPPLAEQRRVVARVEALMERIREAKRLREDSIRDVDGLKTAALIELFSFPGGIPAGWQWTTIADVGSSQRDTVQTGPFGAQLKSSEFTEEGVPVLAIGNIQGGYLDTNDLKYVSESKANQLSRYKIRSGDLLFTRMGTVGRSCVVPDYAEGWLISYHLLRVAVDRSYCLQEYLHYSLGGSQRVLNQLEARSRGATRAGVNTQILMELEFPLPPLGEQHRIIAYLDSIRAQATTLKHAQEDTDAELRRLEQAILDRASRGEL